MPSRTCAVLPLLQIIRLREEGSRQLEEQQRLIREQIRLEREQHGQGESRGDRSPQPNAVRWDCSSLCAELAHSCSPLTCRVAPYRILLGAFFRDKSENQCFWGCLLGCGMLLVETWLVLFFNKYPKASNLGGVEPHSNAGGSFRSCASVTIKAVSAADSK